MKKEIKLNSSILPRFMGSVPGDKMTIGQIIDELKRMYCEFESASIILDSLIADCQVTMSVFNMSTLLTEDSATGSENESSCPLNGNTTRRRSE